ncbi:MAG: Y-family DNA polymerase [Bacteroidales bacterium]|nr:Y-family DNA polymerase [Bacteroidales bacterium]
MYGLADCNNFYVSCERVFNPSLCGKPVIVLSNNDGCVISRSQEAKQLGIKMGEPLFRIKKLIKKERVYLFSSNFALYGDISWRIMERLRQMVPAIEVYSIDEAFIDFRGISDEVATSLARNITSILLRDVGIPVSIGLSTTKTLAKVAARLCKRYPKLNNCCVMNKDSDIEKVLSKFPVEDVWGVGRRYSKMLNSEGVYTAKKFIECNPLWVREKMSIVGLRTWKELNGEPSIGFEENLNDKQQICTSRSFSSDLYDHEKVIMAIAKFASSGAEKLRKQGGVTSQLHIFILTNPFKEGVKEDYRSIVVPLSYPTDSTFEIVKASCSAALSILKSGYGYKKAGVIITDITKKNETTGSLFCEKDLGKESDLMRSLDEINLKYGRDTLVTAAQGVDKIQYNMNNLSRRYTTFWEDIIKVKI